MRAAGAHALHGGSPAVQRGPEAKLKPLLRREASPLAQLSAICFYLAVSAAMSFINKWALMMFPLPMTLMVFQMAAAVAILLPLAASGLLRFNVRSWARCRQLSGITALYVSNAVLSLGGLAKLNIPLYTTLKRLTPIFVLLTKLLLTRQRPPWRVSASVLLIVGGCVLAGAGDLDLNLMGFCFAIGSSFLQALYLVMVEVQGAKGIPTSEMLYYNSITALPLLLAVTAVGGELQGAGHALRTAAAAHGWGSTLMAITLCATGGIVLNFSMFLATVVGSALTMTLVGNLKTVLVLGLGFFLLGGAQLTLLMALGILTTLVGGSWYSSLKFKPPSLNPLNPARTGAALTAPKSPTAALGVGLNSHLNGHVSNHLNNHLGNHHNHLAAGDGGYNATPFASAFVAQTYQGVGGVTEGKVLAGEPRLAGIASLPSTGGSLTQDREMEAGARGLGPVVTAVGSGAADMEVYATVGGAKHHIVGQGHHRHPHPPPEGKGQGQGGK